MTPTNPIPEGMKAYGPEHPDYPNAPSDWDQGDLLLDWGDDDNTQPRFTTCQQEEIDWSAPPSPWRHDIDTDKFALIVAYTPKPTPHVGDSAAERARDFGAQLKAARKRLNFTLRDVEEITAGVVSNPYLSQIESGKIRTPSFKVVCALAAAYAVSLDTMQAWAAFASQEAAQVGEQLPDDVVRLVIAARLVAWEDPDPENLKELQDASELFASRMPWEDQPENEDGE